MHEAHDFHLPLGLLAGDHLGVAQIIAPPHHRSTFGADGWDVAPQHIVDHLACPFPAAETVGVVGQGLAGVLVAGAALVDHLHRAVVPGPGGEAFKFLAGERTAFLVHRIVGVVGRVVECVVVDGKPGAAVEEIGAPLVHDAADDVVPAAGAHGGDSQESAFAKDNVGVVDEVVGDNVEPVVGLVVVFPLGGQVGFVVGFKIVYTGGHQLAHTADLAPTHAIGVGLLTEETHHGHDAGVEQAAAEFEGRSIAVVEQFHPLDVHGGEFGDPKIEISPRRVVDTRRPVDTASIVFGRSWKV